MPFCGVCPPQYFSPGAVFTYWISLQVIATMWHAILFHFFLAFQFQFLQISAFFLFSNIRKGRLPNICSVGRLVGWSVDVTINFFNIYRHKSPLLTQYHSIPISTNQYQVILTQYHLVTTSITPYWPSTIKYQPVLPCKGPVLSYIMMSIATMSIDHNSNKRFALFTWSSSLLFQ